MADIIDFGAYRDPTDMDKAELLAYLDMLHGQIAELDEAEPADMESEAYEEWGQRHEDLEDLVDDVLDCLEELE